MENKPISIKWSALYWLPLVIKLVGGGGIGWIHHSVTLTLIIEATFGNSITQKTGGNPSFTIYNCITSSTILF